MIRQIAPQFFTTDMQATLDYYRIKLYDRAIHFRLARPPVPNPDKYADELLDAYLFRRFEI
jgi:hypothetical protein